MSHFTVMVIGPNIVDQLAPYDENTGNDVTKWDWWVVGGRWTGYFKVRQGIKILGWADGAVKSIPKKPGSVAYVNSGSDTFDTKAEAGFADVIYKGDIDIEGMREDAAAANAKAWDAANEALKKAGVERFSFKTWGEIYEIAKKKEGDKRVNIDLARDEYGEQLQIKALKDAGLLDAWGDAHEKLIRMTREAYIELGRLNAIMSHAYLRGGEWIENAEMGWFASTGPEKQDPLNWAREFNAMFDELPADTLLTVVDCHV